MVYSSCLQCMYYQVGDIVSLVDDEGDVYYAQIRGFLQDQYYEKSAVITWLLPTSASSKEGFDPSTYILGRYTSELQIRVGIEDNSKIIFLISH